MSSKKTAKEDTLVVPILNVYGTGTRISRMVPNVNVLDGCIYIVGFVSDKGEITQMGKVFRLIFGARKEAPIAIQRLEEIRDMLVKSGIKADISDDINRDTFVKWAFISAMACTGAYHDVNMGALQHQGEERNTFIGLSEESAQIARKCGIIFKNEPVTYNLSVIDKLDPHSTASMQKDIAKGHQSEIKGLLFDMIELGEKLGVDMPTYRKVEKKFM
jgi:Ketopantoate reductase